MKTEIKETTAAAQAVIERTAGKDTELLALLEDEEQTQETRKQRAFVLPKRKRSFVQTLAGILRDSKMHRAPTELKGNDLARNIAVCYLVDNLSTNDTNLYLARWNKFTLPRLVLADLAAGIIPETAEGTYDLRAHFEAFAVTVAGDLYHHFFNTLATPFYIEKRTVKGVKDAPDTENKGDRDPKKEDAVTEEARFFRSVRGEKASLTLAAGILEPYLSQFKERITGNEDTQQLKELIGVEAYRSIVRNDAIRGELTSIMHDPQQKTREIFVYAVLSLHRDFFRVLEENGAGHLTIDAKEE